MGFLTRSLQHCLLQAAMAMPVLAAAGERDLADNHAVWMFLGFCALIIVAQVFPLVWHLFHKRSEQVAVQEQAVVKQSKS